MIDYHALSVSNESFVQRSFNFFCNFLKEEFPMRIKENHFAAFSTIVLVVLMIVVFPGSQLSHAHISDYKWHTFYGSNSGDNIPQAVATDSSGSVYITGYSQAAWNGPTGQSPKHAFTGGADIFVVKLDSNGTYQWHTFYGSANTDVAKGIALDDSGNVYVTGYSAATWLGIDDICTPGTSPCPLNAYTGGNEIFVLKLNSLGAYQWHTFYGSSDPDQSYAIAVDSAKNVYVTGISNLTWSGPGVCSTPGTSPCPLNAYNNSEDIFVLKLNTSGAYQWHTFFGSADSDQGRGIALDSSSNVYVTGHSNLTWSGPGVCSTPGTSPCPLNAHSGGGYQYDVFALKLNTGGAYQWHTFYGSTSTDYASGIAFSSNGYAYITGRSDASWNRGATTPSHVHSGGADVFVLKLSSAGVASWHTFYGSAGNDYATGIAADSSGNSYVSGWGTSTWNGSGDTAPWNAHSGGGEDMFFLALSTGGAYVSHAFFGSTIDDEAQGIAVDSVKKVYLAGWAGGTWTTNGTEPLHARSGSNYEIAVVKLNECGGYPISISEGIFRSTMADGYTDVANNGTIKVQAQVISETLLLTRDVSAKLWGGYGCEFSSNTGWTTLNGSLTIRGGNINIDKLIIK
jgi:hypothetical protein